MQISRSFPALIVASVLAVGAAAPAAATFSDWTDGPHVRARLIATTTADATGGPNAALEIELEPGWKTYWRSPGDAGMPPIFDFAGSTNLQGVSVAFPPPEREDDGFTVSNIYSGRVVLPLTVAAADVGKAVDLAMKLDLGVCAEVCIPVTLRAGVAIERGGADAAAAQAIATAAGMLPGAPEAGKFDITGLKRTGGSDDEPAFEFQATVPDPVNTTIFVEGPADWYSDVPKPVNGAGASAAAPMLWRFSFDRLGAKTPLAGAPVRFTVISGDRAMEETVTLD
jgi:suppressor for copper-sensitivity B